MEIEIIQVYKLQEELAVSNIAAVKWLKFKGSLNFIYIKQDNLEPRLITKLKGKEKNMLEHKCEVCGRMSRNKRKADGKVVCERHYQQFKKFGKFLDSCSRRPQDKNKIIICGDISYIELYSSTTGEVIAKAIIDTEDVDKVKNIKWRLNHSGYVYNNSNSSLFLHRRVLGTNQMVDHINHNRLDNRKENLRICTKSQNQMNVNYLGVYKVQQSKEIKWMARIKINQKTIHLGIFVYKEEALYCRWYAEKLVFGEFVFPKPEPNINEQRKEEIQKLVISKVQRL